MILIIVAGSWLLCLLLVTLTRPPEPGLVRARQADVLAIGGIIAATLAFFWRLVFTTSVWMPAGGGDLAGFLYPTFHFAAEWWRRGVIPLWNPYLFAGQPFIGDIQSGILYPLNILTFLTTNPLSYRDLEFLSVVHFMLAGIGMYALLRWGHLGPAGTPPASFGETRPHVADQSQRKQLSRGACLAGAVAFEFSDLFITHFGNLNLIASAAWLPLVFLFFMLAVDHSLQLVKDSRERSDVDAKPLRTGPFWKALGASAATGVFVALSFFAGHIQSFLIIILALALYALHRAIESYRNVLPILAIFVSTLAVAAGISAVTLIPGVEMARASVRSSFTYEDAAQFSLPPAELVGLLVPGFFGRGPQNAWGPWPRVEVGYLGVFPIILSGLAILLRRNSKITFFGLLSLVGLILALGGFAIAQGWLYALVPGFGQLRAPARFVLLLDFGLAALTGIGFDVLVNPLTDQQKRPLSAIASKAPWVLLIVALAVGGVTYSILILGQGQDPVLFSRIANAANSMAFFVLLLAFSVGLLVARDRAILRPSAWTVLALALIIFDLFSLGAYVDVGLSDPTAAYNRNDIVGFLQSQRDPFRIDSRTDVQGIWLPDTALMYGLSDVNGDNPLVLSDWNIFWEALGSRATRMYDLLNVKYVLGTRNTPLEQNFRRVFDGQSGITVYENAEALPRAWLVYAAKQVGPTPSAIDQVKSPRFDPSRYVLLEDNSAPQLPDSGLGADEASIIGYGPNEIDLAANAKQDGYLVLSEVYYPGWRATVDGEGVQVFRADGLFRTIFLGAGEHQIRFVYDPITFKLGVGISVFTIVALLLGAVYLLRQKLLDSRV